MSDARSEFPREWSAKSLEQLCARITSGGTPASGSPRYYLEHGGLPFAKTEDLTRARTKFIEECELKISHAALKETAAKRYPAGTILLSMYGTIGLTKISGAELAANQALCALIPPFACSPDYLYHHLDYIRPEWLKYSGQTTQANINGAAVRAHEVPMPSGHEQRKIARILDTLDTAIHETEAIIAKIKAVKQGLLNDLLTRGIDANGELRPPQAEAPHLYKQSPLGWIPKEWGTPTLALVCRLIRDGTHLPPPRVKDGPLLLSVRNMQDGRFLLTDQDTRVSETFYKQMHKNWEIQNGDVLLAIVGATIGKTAMVGDMPKFTLQRSVAVLRGKPDLLMNEFLHLYLGAPEFQASLWTQVNQTAQPGIYLDQLGAIPIRAPLPPEQQAIQLRLQTAQRRIDDESDYLQKLRKQKAGLMDDLLTGRVRVTPLLADDEQQKDRY